MKKLLIVAVLLVCGLTNAQSLKLNTTMKSDKDENEISVSWLLTEHNVISKENNLCEFYEIKNAEKIGDNLILICDSNSEKNTRFIINQKIETITKEIYKDNLRETILFY